MHLIRDDIVTLAAQVGALFSRRYNVPLDRLHEWQYWSNHLPPGALAEYSHAVDFTTAGIIVAQSQTFLFDQEQILAFLAAADRRLPPGDYPAPFPFVCIQFSRGIDETLLTSGKRPDGSTEPSDEILGLLLATPEDSPVVNILAWYKSTSLNHVQLPVSGDGEIRLDMLTSSDDRALAATLRQDKQRIANLALLCLAYIHSPGVETEHVQADAAANKKRAAKGKRELPDYYICHVRHQQRPGQAGETSGRHVSFRFDVSGHFRRLADGRTIWIKPHQRGLDQELYKPKTYKVD